MSPSFRNVPFTGLEWSFRCKDEGFDCDGLLAGRAYEDVEKGSHIHSLNPGDVGSDDDIDDEVEMITISGLAEGQDVEFSSQNSQQ